MKTDPIFIVAFLNDALIRERIDKRLSINDIAEEARIPKATLYRKFNGLTPWRIPELAAVCDVLGVRLTNIVAQAEQLAEDALDARYAPVSLPDMCQWS